MKGGCHTEATEFSFLFFDKDALLPVGKYKAMKKAEEEMQADESFAAEKD